MQRIVTVAVAKTKRRRFAVIVVPLWISSRVIDKQSIARIEQIINNSMMTSGEKCRWSCCVRPHRRDDN